MSLFSVDNKILKAEGAVEIGECYWSLNWLEWEARLSCKKRRLSVLRGRGPNVLNCLKRFAKKFLYFSHHSLIFVHTLKTIFIAHHQNSCQGVLPLHIYACIIRNAVYFWSAGGPRYYRWLCSANDPRNLNNKGSLSKTVIPNQGAVRRCQGCRQMFNWISY